MRYRNSLLLTLILGLSACTHASQTSGVIDPSRMAAHVTVLAGDDYEGRAPGTTGEAKTIAYIAQQMAAVGLQPVAGGDWFQPMSIVEVAPRAVQIEIAGARIDNGPDAIFWTAAAQPSIELRDSEAIFVGYGIHAPDKGRDDLAGLDLKGKSVFFMIGAPEGDGAWPTRAARVAELKKRGAAAVIGIHPQASDGAEWKAMQGQLARPQRRLADTADVAPVIEGVMSATAADRFLSATVRQALKPVVLGARVNATVANDVRRIETRNVAGVLRGSKRPDEYLLYMAHWDGLGRCRPATESDSICNGAVDNASGIAGLIELARAFATHRRPERSILFLATTAEEWGLLGGDHYAAHPLVPLDKTVAGFNFDTIALRARGANVVVLGEGLTDLDPLIAQAARAQGRGVEPADHVAQFFKRSDHYSLVEKGVPVLIATSIFARTAEPQSEGYKRAEDYLSKVYHSPSDEMSSELRFDGAAQDVDLAYRVGRMLADSDDWPGWKPGVEYGAARAAGSAKTALSATEQR